MALRRNTAGDAVLAPSGRRSGHLAALSTFARLALDDRSGRLAPRASNREHLDAAIGWLGRAHDVTSDDGVSYGYSVKGGWRPSYRETSGYIAVTFFDLAARTGFADFRERALTVSRWLIAIQNDDGSISNPAYDRNRGIVFDTGQVLLGYLRAYAETNDAAFIEAASKAGRWLAERIDDDGAWRQNTHNDCSHAYHSRVAWALAKLGSAAGDQDFVEAARRNLDWVLAQERNGWFDQCAFTPGAAPFTHTIAYAIRGVLEAGLLLGDARYLGVATRTADAVRRHVRADGFIAGQFDVSGRPVGEYVCLTGNCQLAIVWLKLHARSGDAAYLTAAQAALDYVMAHQDIQTPNSDVKGGIKGSQPIWGRYARFSYPNWAAKFFVDAMLLLEQQSS
jgi:uncharacterized protein YyaL (SSP411 family)